MKDLLDDIFIKELINISGIMNRIPKDDWEQVNFIEDLKIDIITITQYYMITFEDRLKDNPELKKEKPLLRYLEKLASKFSFSGNYISVNIESLLKNPDMSESNVRKLFGFLLTYGYSIWDRTKHLIQGQELGLF